MAAISNIRNHLDIYNWDPKKTRFVYHESIVSKLKNSRMAGALFQYKGAIYCPSQNCEKNYGGGIDIKRVEQTSEGFSFQVCKKLRSPHKKRRIALHTLNEYKGLVVIDVGGYDFPIIGSLLHRIIRMLKRI